MVATIERLKPRETYLGNNGSEKIKFSRPWNILLSQTRKQIAGRKYGLYLSPTEVLEQLTAFAGQEHEDFPSSTLEKIRKISEEGRFSSLRQPYKLLLKANRYREKQLRKMFGQDKPSLNGYQADLETIIGEQLAIIAELNPRKLNMIISNAKNK